MNRRIGIPLILLGIGIWIASGFLFPAVVHKIDLGPSDPSFTPLGTQKWLTYAGGVLLLVGMTFLLNHHVKKTS